MKLFARHILLAALLLRALVPLGWMPGSAQLGQAAWIICTADGQIQHGAPGKDDGRTQHQQVCAFAAAHVLASPEAANIAAALLQVASLEPGTLPASLRIAAAFTPQSPRAPPLSA
jgi:hypothetical protein